MKRTTFTLILLLGLLLMAPINLRGVNISDPSSNEITYVTDNVVHFKLLLSYEESSTSVWTAGQSILTSSSFPYVMDIAYSYVLCKHDNVVDTILSYASRHPAEKGYDNVLNGSADFILHSGIGVCTNRAGKYNGTNLNPISPIVKPTHFSDGSVWHEIIYFKTESNNNPNHAVWMDMDWHIPGEWAGQSVSFDIVVNAAKCNKSTSAIQESHQYIFEDVYNSVLPEESEAYPELMDATIAVSNGDENSKIGKMMIPWMAQERVKGYQVYINNHPYGEYTSCESEFSGFIYVPISDSTQDVYMECLQEYNHDSLSERTVRSTSVSVAPYHRLHDLEVEHTIDTLTGLRSGAVRLTWHMNNMQTEDAVSTDMFIVERATKSDFSDAVMLDMLVMSNATDYEYIDESDAIRKQNADSAFYVYRVRRASTQIWSDQSDVVASGLGIQKTFYVLYPLDEDEKIGHFQGIEAVKWSEYILDDFEDMVYKNVKNPHLMDSKPWKIANTISFYVKNESRNTDFQQDTFYMRDRSDKIVQPYIKVAKATPADDWEVSRKVNVFGYTKQLYSYDQMYTFRGLESGTASSRMIANFRRDTVPGTKKALYYWDHDHVMLYLVRMMYSESNVTTVELPIPNDSISYNAELQQFEVHMTDVVEKPCVEYIYYIRMQDLGSVLPIENNNANIKETFFYDSGMSFDSLHASDRVSPDFTSLNWTTKGGGFDEYQIWRKSDTTSVNGTYSLIATTDKNYYIDRHAPIGVPCMYKVVGVTTCVSTTKDSIFAIGWRDCYGSVSGHVTYPNGISCPGVKVTATDTLGHQRFTYTDDQGNYYIDSLFFSDEGCTYFVTVTDEQNSVYKTSAGGNVPMTISLDGTTAIITNINFTNTSFVRFEGRVLYEYSTVPVPNAQFMVNGRLLVDASGEPIQTDASGNFDLMIQSGQTRVQIIKEGHTFANNGYFTDESGDSIMTLHENVYGQRIYDQTRITLIGRLTGGNTEGSKPLGKGESVNTLGDDLTLVLELEGDNISQLVHYPTDPDKTEVDTVFHHLYPQDSTTMETTRKRITIHPDVRTGEYQVALFPARYKVVQATATGYATLFPAGLTSQSLDLTNCVHPIDSIVDTIVDSRGVIQVNSVPYHSVYSITYHAPLELKYEQLKYGIPTDYLGEKSMPYTSLMKNDTTISLIITDTLSKSTVGYTFGYPVYKSGQTYGLSVSACEVYRYNNDPSSSQIWEVYLPSGEITMFNGLSHDATPITATIDSITHQAIFEYIADYPSFVFSGEQALRTLTLRMDYEGLYVYSQPIQAYVYGSRAKGVETLRSIGSAIRILDVIRDPYGANSYSYIDAGTTYHASYQMDFMVRGGVNFKVTTGTDTWASTGLVTAPMGVGIYNGTVTFKQSVDVANDIPVAVKFEGYSNADYSFTTSERISTSSDPTMVGAKADIYLGTATNIYAGLIDAVTIIDSTDYRMLQPAFAAGTMHLLATPRDDSPYYLVVREQVELGENRPVTFAYTQKHILDVLLPQYIQARNSMLLFGDSITLQAMADSIGSPVYGSLVPLADSNFGTEGSYVMYSPRNKGLNSSGKNNVYGDKVNEYNELIGQWCRIINNNEEQKINASSLGQLLTTYSLSSSADISYSETASHSSASDWHWRGMSTLTGMAAGLAPEILQLVWKYVIKGGAPSTKTEFSLFGIKFALDFEAITDFEMPYKGTQTSGNNKSAGFVLSTSNGSSEDISVYRLTDNSYNRDNQDTRDDAYKDVSDEEEDSKLYADFVFLRRSGVTRCPYEGEETTLFYHRGSLPEVLAVATQRIDQPIISINTPEISNVPADQPATFILTLSNESELTYDPNLMPTSFTLLQDEKTNANGLIIMIDGQPLKNGCHFVLGLNESIQKTMQVYRGTTYDYENIGLVFRSECDRYTNDSTSFSVHYQPVSCPVTMSLPVQNWILNTLSPKDDAGYYLPVEINGFDINYDQFDHIDLQYKLKTQSDDQWITQCSFYADSALYQAASGNKAMIENGMIRNVKFYGERDPMEQQYDLRAVSFCRFGNGFLTRSSEMRSGLKDTRVPQLFGVAEPTNGILQVGDYIKIPFSENIAANYLDEDNNFEVTGYTNQSSVTSSTSVMFDGEKGSYAATDLTRDWDGRDISIDLMVMPESADRDMVYFMHGNEDSYCTLGHFYNGNGTNNIVFTMVDRNGWKRIMSSDFPLQTEEWSHVVATYEHETGMANLYLNGQKIGTQKLYPDYKGSGPYVLGGDMINQEHEYAGRCMEFRIWNKELNEAEVQATNNKKLSGYENGLSSYFPMNEGHDTIAYDHTGGMIMKLHGQSWTHPNGKALNLQGDTLRLKGSAFPSSLNSDFTYTTWFRVANTPDTVNLFDSYSMKLLLTSHSVILQEQSMSAEGAGQFMDNTWHHVAVTSNHSTGHSAIYVDGKSVAQFSSTNVAGPSDSEMRVGPMNGSIDDITYWEMALPDYYLTEFYNHTPNNKEMGLITHLSFSERQLVEDGSKYVTRYNPYNNRIRYDEKGNIKPYTEEDRVVLNDDDRMSSLLVENAPIREKGDLVKLGFNWIGKDNELIVNLKTQDREINKQNIFITVRDVEDLAGNPQQSPLSWTLFVDRNQLRWSEKYLQTVVDYGTEGYLSVDLINKGGITTNYYINQLPWWLTASSERGQLTPLDETPIQFTVSKSLDPGEYIAIVYLTDDNQLSEPLRISVVVKATTPDWQVNPMAGNGETMNMFARVMIEGASMSYFDTDTADIVAAFLGTTCISVEHLIKSNNQSMVCMSFKDSNDPDFIENVKNKTGIRFMLWRAATGQIYALNPIDSASIYYVANTIVGSPDDPLILITSDYRVQQIPLATGWNWISFNIDPDHSSANFTGSLLDNYHFTEGDFIKCHQSSQSYENNRWQGILMPFYKDYIYMLRVAHEGQLGIQGYTIPDNQRTVTLRNGWNHLPYLCENTQDVTTALSGYNDFAQPGDIVKSYRAFAMLNSQYRWVGSLNYLQPGEGYMLYRQGTETVVMPYQTLLSEVADIVGVSEYDAVPACVHHSDNMPVVATVPGASFGDRLEAYDGNMLVGVSEADSLGRFMMMTYADEQSRLAFRYVPCSMDKSVENTAPIISYSSLNSVGTVDNPYVIDFARSMVSAYPNPFTDYIRFVASVDADATIDVHLYDASGMIMWSQSFTHVEGGCWQYVLDGLTTYPQGIYIAVISINGMSNQIKLIKE